MKSVTVKLDLSKTDEEIHDISKIHEILVVYENVGEGEEWTDSVPFEVVEKEKEPHE